MLLATEVYGLYALAILTWFSWSRPTRERPAATPGRSVDVYVCTYDEPTEVVDGDARRLPRAHLPAHDLPARRRPAAGDGGARRAGRRRVPDPPRQRPRQGGQPQRRPAADRGRPRPRPRRRPRADARRPRRPGRLLRRRADGDGADAARLLQPRLGPALRRRPPRAIALLPGRLPRQGPPRRRLLVRLGGADQPPRAARRSAASPPRRSPRTSTRRSGCSATAGAAATTTRSWSRALPRTTSTATCCSATAGPAATSPSSPCPSRRCGRGPCSPLQRLSYFASLLAYLAPPMRLLLLLTLGLVLWTGELPMKISVAALAALWLPSLALNLSAGAAARPRLHADPRDRPLRAADDGDLHPRPALHSSPAGPPSR